MIVLTKLRGEEFILNSDLIETVTEHPDTTIVLTNGNVFIVQESMEEVVRKVIAFRKQVRFP